MAAEVGNAVGSGVASKVAELLFDPIQREICYVFKYKTYVEKLRSQLGDLNNIKQRLEQTVENAKRQGDKIFDDVEQYVIKMNEFIAGAEKLVEEEKDKVKNKRCIIGLCPNLMSRHKLSKEAINAAKDADDLLRMGSFKLDTAVSYRPAPERTDIANVTRGYQEFDSRMKVFNNVMEALKDSNIDMIGVYGMGGVGKTTLAKQVEKKVVEDKLFDEVAMAEVTQTPDFKTIQDKFAYDLGLTFLQHESAFERVDRLRRRLKEKRVLVILDNIWGELKLEDVGIPFGDDEKKGKSLQRRCTVLLTSRSHHVLRNDMNSLKNFPIEVLSNEEAMVLFWKTVDDHSMETSNFQFLADEIVRKCEGLPVAIKTIAGALKNKAIEVWKDALNRLRNSDTRHIPGMEANVYSAVKLSYNILVNEEAKCLFLLCALQNDGSRIVINNLMTYVMGSGWFKNVSGLEEARNRVHALIDNLKSSCLLLDGDNEHVKMHDIIHAVGVSIAAEEHMFNIQNVRDLKEELKKDPIAISLTCRDIQELPERLECPNLKLFSFGNYGSNLEIQSLCFEGMNELRVLNLTRIVFPSLPPLLSSLACLSNLKTLSLIDCFSVVDVALIGELKKLEILSFRGSDIEQLPMEIGQLTQLKKLDLSHCWKLNVIAPNVISKLTRLEELCMANSFTQWEKGEGGSNASLVELTALSQLTTLEINISDVKIVPPDLASEELERFKIFLGDQCYWHWDDEPKTSRTLKLKGLVKSGHFGQGMKTLLKRAEELYLDELIGFYHFHELNYGEGFPQLKDLSLKNSPEISYIVNLARPGCCNAFPLLESLSLHNLINLEKICHGQLTEDQSFSKLRIIKVEECHELKHLFSFSMAKNLSRLQEIEVTNCNGLKLIVGEERESYILCGNEGINFAQLHSFALTGLPQLRCSGFNLDIPRRSATSSSASKEIVAEDDPQDFITLFNNKVTFPTLETLKLSSLNIEKIWLDQFSNCQNLTKLEVKDCCYLKFLFSYSMVPSLVQLQNLVVEVCNSMEWVINTCRLRRDEEEMTFSKLNSLTLSKLPGLKRFVSLSSWEENNIIHTDTNTQSLFDEKVIFPTLEILKLSSLNIQNVWLDQFCPCQSLTTLEVQNCRHLKFLFSNSMVHCLEQLQNLVIENCMSMEWVINTSGLRRDEEQMIGVVVFPKLKSLTLSHLPRLRRFVSMSSLEENGCEKVEILFGSSELSRRQKEGQQSMFLIDLDKVGLPSLEILTIEDMSNLRKIWHHQLHLDSFSKLKQLEVRSCDKLMNIFSSNIILGRRFQRLEKVTVKHCELIKEIIEEETSSNRMVDEEFPIANTTSRFQVFPQLTRMELYSLPNLESFYQGVHMFECVALEDLRVYNCDKVEILYGSELLNQGTETSQLVFLIDRRKVVFPNIKCLSVSSCNGLRNLMALSTVEGLVKLKRMEIVFCKMIEEIVLQDEVKVHPFFSQLVSLELCDLPRLKHFFGGNYTLEFPYLEQVVVSGCLNMKIFSEGVLCTPKLQKVQLTSFYPQEKEQRWEGSLNSTIQKMFQEMAGFYGLESLILSEVPQVKEIWHGQTIPVGFFCNLWSLKVDDCKLMSSAIPANLLCSLTNLMILSVGSCDSVEEVLHIEELNADEHSVQLFPNLSDIYLSDLPNLKRFCNISQNIIELPSLKYLYIRNCPNIETFISTSTEDQPLFNKKVIFPNLEELRVYNCNGLRNLMTLSTVESLVKFKRIDIISCRMIEEIILLDEKVKVDPIFSQLVSLELRDLPRLKHFFWGNYTLEFPYLEQVVVSGCLNMTIFSQGVLRTPKLQKVQLTNYYEKYREQENEERWEGSLNSTIQKMFEEMAGFYGLKSLILSEVPQVQEIWHGQTIPVGFLCNLRSLEVDDCKLMSGAIPTNLLRFLKNLRILKVKNCDSVEEVFQMEELNAAEYSVQLFPTHDQSPCNEKVALHNLKRLELSNLPKLLHLCKENSSPINVFQNLETLEILECSKLEHVVPSWVSFQNLIKMEVSKCDGLITLMPFSTTKSLGKLERMKITNCKMIEEIIHAGEEVKKDCIVFSKLEHLELSCLPSLAGFFLGNYTLEFPCLKQVIVKECPMMKMFSRGILSTPKLEGLKLPNTEEEIVKKDEWLWEGSLNSTIQKLFKEKNVQSSKDEDE